VSPHLLGLYLVAVFLAMIAPGPDMMFVLAVGARGGPRAGLMATLGVAGSAGGRLSGRYAYLRGAVTNLVNPKMVTFVVAFLPQFVDRGLGHVPLQFAVLGAIFIGFEVLIDGTVGLTARRLGDWLSRRRRARQAVDIGSGTIMVALAARLALEVR
jgi:threonine/homoserine/homoserine lactone efflux protein